MIEKLREQDLHLYYIEPEEVLLKKINELVDVVNGLQMKLEPEKCEPTETPIIPKMENVSFGTGRRIDISYIDDVDNDIDTYAEQRKWIGKVCRFWFNDINDTCLDYLDKIQTGENGIEYYGKETYDWFPHCEPILPTDNAIYKGGDNE